MFALDQQALLGASRMQDAGAAAAAAAAGSAAAAANPADTRNPVTTTASVLALTYKDGVLMVADTTVSYGRMVRFKHQGRFFSLGGKTLICSSGEYSDHQFLRRHLEALYQEETAHAEGGPPSAPLTSKALAAYTARLLYQKRSNMNPYWLNVVVAGHLGPPAGIHAKQQQQQQQQQQEQQQQESHMYLGTMDLLGTFFEEQVIATGLGRYFAITLMRERHRPDMSEQEARSLLEECMRILFYRDCAASNEVSATCCCCCCCCCCWMMLLLLLLLLQIQFAKVTAEGVTIDEPIKLDSNWHFDAYIKKTTDMDLAGCSW
ncbi:hypothetical protein Efla_007284 [Eimeria flavescens]